MKRESEFVSGSDAPDAEIQAFRHLERRRMIEIKDRISTLLDESVPDPRPLHACVRYLVFIVGRFVAQGLSNIEYLRLRVAPDDSEGHDNLEALEGMLHRAHARIGELRRALDDTQSGQLREAASNFVAFYDARMAPRKNDAQSIITKYVPSDEYWKVTADVTAVTIAREAELYAEIPPVGDEPESAD